MRKTYLFLIITFMVLIIGGCVQEENDTVYIYASYSEGLTNGYSTISVQKHLNKLDKSVVSSLDIVENDDNTVTTTISIFSDLRWSDGKSITAKDYVFSILIDNNPLALDIRYKDAPSRYEIKGIYKYRNPINNKNGDMEFPGVQLINDYTFSITVIKYKNLKIEDNIISVHPLARHILAPSCEVIQGEEGARLENFSKDEFKKNYELKYEKTITSGPYYLSKTTKDGDEVYKINEYYKGNYEGQKPQIKEVVLSNRMNNKNNYDIIAPFYEYYYESMNISEKDNYKLIPYPTIDYNTLEISCDEPSGASSSIKVRQALAHLVDNKDTNLFKYRNQFGLYTLKSWEYAFLADENGEILGRNSTEELVELNTYVYSLEMAEQLLIDDGWIWADKDASVLYDESNPEHIFRFKKYDSGYWKDQVLSLEISYGPSVMSNDIFDFYHGLKEDAKKIGIDLYLSSSSGNGYFGENNDGYDKPIFDSTIDKWIIPSYDKDKDDRKYQMTLMFSGILPIGPNYYNHVSLEHWGKGNSNYINDLELIQYSEKMHTASTKEEYLIAWQQFQYRYNYLLPSINLGVNTIYILYDTTKLEGFEKVYTMSWHQALLYSSIKENNK